MDIGYYLVCPFPTFDMKYFLMLSVRFMKLWPSHSLFYHVKHAETQYKFCFWWKTEQTVCVSCNRLHIPSSPTMSHHSKAEDVHSGPYLSFPHIFIRQVCQCSSNCRCFTHRHRLRRWASWRAARHRPSQTEVCQLRHQVAVQQDVWAAEEQRQRQDTLLFNSVLFHSFLFL